MSKTETVTATIVYHRGHRSAIMRSERPRLVGGKEVGIEATGQMLQFAPRVQGREGMAMPLDRAFAPELGADNLQKETMELEAVDGIISGPSGQHLAAMREAGDITFECSGARLPALKGFQTRAALKALADRDAGVASAAQEMSIIEQLQARLAALEGSRAAA